MGSGICGNQMCWQLRGKWQSGVGDLGWGLVPFRLPGLPLTLAPPTPVLRSLDFPSFSASTLFSFAFRALYLILGREQERRGLSPSPSPSCCCLLRELHFPPLGFSAHPPTPVFPSVFSCLSSSP